MTDPPAAPTDAWRHFRAPSLADFEALAGEEFARLPEQFRATCGHLVIRVAEFATDDVLEEMGIDDPFDLMGLFQGVGLPFQAAGAVTGQMPNMVWLYRRPILDYWAEHEEALGAVIAHVLIHELGHHFGFSDADMEAIEAGLA